MATKVFVSHSAKSEAHRALLDDFEAQLETAGLEPWVDRKRIEVGAEWNEEITKGLHECHAAVILFSKTALQSDFVTYEVSCLTYRKRTEPGFGLFPVVLDNTSIPKLTKGFLAKIRFDDYQIGPLAEKRGDIVDKLLALDPSRTSPTGELEGVLFRIFRDIAPEVLRAAAAERQWDTWEHVPIPDAEALYFVRRILAAPIEHQVNALNRIKKALPAGCSIGDLFDQIAPCWVDERAATQLHAARMAKPGQRGVVVNGTHGNFTCDMFLKRARPIEDTGILQPLGSGSTTPADSGISGAGGGLRGGGIDVLGGLSAAGRLVEEDLTQRVRDALCHHFGVTPRDKPSETDAAIDEEIEFFEKAGRPPVQVLQLGEDDVPSVEPLLRTFQRVTFVVMTGEHIPQLDPNLKNRLQTVAPPLLHDDAWLRHNEGYAFQWCSRKNRLLGIST